MKWFYMKSSIAIFDNRRQFNSIELGVDAKLNHFDTYEAMGCDNSTGEDLTMQKVFAVSISELEQAICPLYTKTTFEWG